MCEKCLGISLCFNQLNKGESYARIIKSGQFIAVRVLNGRRETLPLRWRWRNDDNRNMWLCLKTFSQNFQVYEPVLCKYRKTLKAAACRRKNQSLGELLCGKKWFDSPFRPAQKDLRRNVLSIAQHKTGCAIFRPERPRLPLGVSHCGLLSLYPHWNQFFSSSSPAGLFISCRAFCFQEIWESARLSCFLEMISLTKKKGMSYHTCSMWQPLFSI